MSIIEDGILYYAWSRKHENDKNVRYEELPYKEHYGYEKNKFGYDKFLRIYLPSEVHTIANGAFDRDTVKYIGYELYSTNGLEIIESGAFNESVHLLAVNLPSSLKAIQKQAFLNCFRLQSVDLKEGLEVIEDKAFSGCHNLHKITMPSTIKFVGQGVFSDSALEELKFCGKTFNDSEIICNFNEFVDFLKYALLNKKFIPQNNGIIRATNKADIENFYEHSNDWKTILTAYNMKWLSENSPSIPAPTIADLYKISYALGLLEGGKKSNRAKEFIINNIVSIPPDELHQVFGGLDTRKFRYIEEFADFFIANYRQPIIQSGVKVHFLESFDSENNLISYVAQAYNNWENRVKTVFPNRTVIRRGAHASQNNSLTEEDVVNSLKFGAAAGYDDPLARLVAPYNYTKENLDKLIQWFDIAKHTDPYSMVLTANKDECKNGIRFELLEKNNPEQTILGEKTNCCQTVDDAGASCVEYGLTKPNSGFIKFSLDDKIVGQSWVWYNIETGLVCLDNIEIPTIWRQELDKSKELEASFSDCLIRLASAIQSSMKENGFEVSKVTVGSGYNDFAGIKNFDKIKSCRASLPNDYNGYSDSVENQYVISGRTLKSLYGDSIDIVKYQENTPSL